MRELIQGSLFETEDEAFQPCNITEPVALSRVTAHKGHGVKASDAEKAIACLSAIPADCGYHEWFRICCALKHSGCKYEVFRDWSATAPEKFSEEDCKRTWEAISMERENQINLGTLIWMAEENSGVIPAMLPVPQTEEELAEQVINFIETHCKTGEFFEVVTETMTKDGRAIPLRRKDALMEYRTEDELRSKILPITSSCQSGAWVSLNPLKSSIQGKAPADGDVSSYRYTLIEADELSMAEQWERICKLYLPVKSVVWSGGKSLHVIVKIDAGEDRELYDMRVRTLHGYLTEKGFPFDKANKNPSRLTRLPGFRRGTEAQYLVANEFGPATWEEFETRYFTKQIAANPMLAYER